MSVTIYKAPADIFASSAQAIAIGCNVVGVPGKGIALAAAERYPWWASDYKAACREERLAPGGLWATQGPLDGPNPGWIVAVAVKAHWCAPSQMEWVVAGLMALAEWAPSHHVATVAVPSLGCGLGGLDWDEVRPVAERILGDVAAVGWSLYEPHEPAGRMPRRSRR